MVFKNFKNISNIIVMYLIIFIEIQIKLYVLSFQRGSNASSNPPPPPTGAHEYMHIL